jgi:SAM-dependent methyltransferase
MPLPDDAVLKQIYGTMFDYRWYQDHYDAKLRDCRMRVREYESLLGKRVLDFGGGVGYFSKAVAETNRESVTYDPYVSETPPASGGWDTVVALHVLEHSNNLERTLEEIKGFLAPGGRLILAVPNFASRGYRELGMDWVWAQPPLVHVFHFTSFGLRALLERHGFADIRISFHERWDANLYCDLAHAEQYRRWDALWSLRPFNRFTAYRRWVARRNASLRFAGLEEALRGSDTQSDIHAELQVTAVLKT